MRKGTFKAFELNNRILILRQVTRKPYAIGSRPKYIVNNIEQPNFKGTGMALCGVLKQNQTEQDFIDSYNIPGRKGENHKNASV